MFNLSCSICSELYAQSDEIFTTGCGHIFHNLCLREWLARSSTCPQCRKASTVQSIHRIYINSCNATNNVDQNTVQELLQNANLAMTQKEAECEKIRKQVDSLKSTHLQDLAKEKKVSSEKNQKLTEQLRVASKDVSIAKMKEMTYKSTIAELTEDLNNLKCSQAQLQAVWSKSEIASQKELKMKTDTVTRLNVKLKEAEDTATRLTVKLEEVESECQETRNKHVMSLQNIEVLTDELEDTKFEANDLKFLFEHVKNEKQLMQNELTKAHKELKMKTDTATRLNVKLKEAESICQETRNKHAMSLQNIEELTSELKDAKSDAVEFKFYLEHLKNDKDLMHNELIKAQKELKIKTNTAAVLPVILKEVGDICYATKNKHFKSMRIIQKLTSELEDAKSDAKEFKFPLEHLKNDKQLMHNEITKAHKELKMKTDTVTRLIVKIKEVEDTASHLFGKLKLVEDVYHNSMKIIEERTNELHRAKREADLFKERLERQIRQCVAQKVVR